MSSKGAHSRVRPDEIGGCGTRQHRWTARLPSWSACMRSSNACRRPSIHARKSAMPCAWICTLLGCASPLWALSCCCVMCWLCAPRSGADKRTECLRCAACSSCSSCSLPLPDASCCGICAAVWSSKRASGRRARPRKWPRSSAPSTSTWNYITCAAPSMPLAPLRRALAVCRNFCTSHR